MKLWITPDEEYPIYRWSVEPVVERVEIELTTEEFKKVEGAYVLFYEVIGMLEQKFKASK